MKTITKANHKRYLTEISDYIINELKGIKVDNPNSNLICFDVDTNIGKLSIKLDSEKSVVYSIYSKFENVSKAKELFDCNPFSGKYNLHCVDEHIDNFLFHAKRYLSNFKIILK
jgi:hypothetical protein